MPSPLACNETSKHLVNALWFMSRGGSKSVVCNEDVETILCPIHGVTDVLLVEYTQNKNYVIDRPEGGFSTLDVDKVDYVKYRDLRKVDQYIHARVEEGDCLYIPYRWYRQMNGHANSGGMNVALNVWFSHLHGHVPTCTRSTPPLTLDMFQYSDHLPPRKHKADGENEADGNEDVEDEDDEVVVVEKKKEEADEYLIKHFYSYFKYIKRQNITFKEFYALLKKDHRLTKQDHKGLKFPETFKTLAQELFGRLDSNNDTSLTRSDFSKIVKNYTMKDTTLKYLEYQSARIEDYVEDLVEAKYHNESLHKFEERMKEKFRSQRKFDEL